MSVSLHIKILVAVFLLSLQTSAQVQINFLPSVNGQSLSGVTFFQVNNLTNTEFNASIRIIISEERVGKVAEINSRPAVIRKGLTSFNQAIIAAKSIKFFSNQVSSVFQQTNKLPEGEYEYCYEITSIGEKAGIQDFYENCFHHILRPLSPLLLVDPIDGEEICNIKPGFIWQPPMPSDLNASYRLLLTEIKENQTSREALSYNNPIINLGDLRVPRINYPLNSKALEKGKKYAWQVLYSVNNMLLSRSEIWTFKINCEEDSVIETKESYREILPGNTNGYYVANRILKFAINNSYTDMELAYNIYNLSESNKAIKNLPSLKLNAGLNKYDLMLYEYPAFKEGNSYLLEIKMPDGQLLNLKFIYHE